MRHALILSGSLAIFALSPCSAAQQPAAAQQAPPLLQRAMTALAGGAAIADVTLTGTARRIAGSDDESGAVTLKALASGESRADFSFPSGPRSEVRGPSQGANIGVSSGPDGVRHSIPQHNVMTDSSWFFPGLTLARLLTPQHYAVSYVGHETRNGRAVEHLTASQTFTDLPANVAPMFQRLSRIDIFLDSTTMLPAALALNTHPDSDMGLDIPIEIRFSDYRPVGGASVPFRIQKFLNNGLILDIQINTVNLNTGLAASAFNVQ